ncbi:hypothetical protein [Streptomyces djakartensis]|uniref:Extensin n=1 Tax=Streptomyces djakartensis TaxID=68193 RepID=A0ABQ2Z600_9ACTN|nr:hypothetical protein [Streptomyces djakartensis]GGY02391.1 hypothetical protein GCM10010384_02850 [Streptomyces djakartensis]
MADEQYRWLDRETAERLLSGEPLEAVDGAAGDRAERLARTLGALSAPPPLTSEELPGEAAALAAFRKARAERPDAGAARTGAGGHSGDTVADAGLVRIGTPRGSGSGDVRRPRRARPARLALAAVLAVGMVGGVAVAAGTGVLRAPFGGDEPHPPGASVSAAVTPPERPLVSPSPGAGGQGGSGPGASPGDASTGDARDPGRTEAHDDTAPQPGSGDENGGPGDGRRKLASACRDLRDGKRLTADRRHALRDAADGTRVWRYCKGLLAGADGRSAQRHDEDAGQGEREGGARKHDRKRDDAERKAKEWTERKAEERSERHRDDDDDAGRTRSTRSLFPLRPAVSYSAEISSPRV